MSRLDKWAVAAIAIVDENDIPLLLRTYTSLKSVVQSDSEAYRTHLYVGMEDVTLIRLLIFASLDRCALRGVQQTQLKHSTRGIKQVDQAPTTNQPRENSLVSSRILARNPNNSAMDQPSSSSMRTVAAASASYTAIDEKSLTEAAVSEHSRPKLTSTSDPRYLGIVLRDYRFTCYAFITVSRLTVVLVSVGYVEAPGDAVMPLCRAVYEAASMAMCNPFRTAQRAWAVHKHLLAQYARQTRAAREDDNQGANKEVNEDAAQGTVPAQVTSICTTLNDSACSCNGDDMVLEKYLQLSEGVHEDSWPFAHNTFVQGPPLVFSRAFNAQIESILCGFTVSSRSVAAE